MRIFLHGFVASHDGNVVLHRAAMVDIARERAHRARRGQRATGGRVMKDSDQDTFGDLLSIQGQDIPDIDDDLLAAGAQTCGEGLARCIS